MKKLSFDEPDRKQRLLIRRKFKQFGKHSLPNEEVSFAIDLLDVIKRRPPEAVEHFALFDELPSLADEDPDSYCIYLGRERLEKPRKTEPGQLKPLDHDPEEPSTRPSSERSSDWQTPSTGLPREFDLELTALWARFRRLALEEANPTREQAQRFSAEISRRFLNGEVTRDVQREWFRQVFSPAEVAHWLDDPMYDPMSWVLRGMRVLVTGEFLEAVEQAVEDWKNATSPEVQRAYARGARFLVAAGSREQVSAILAQLRGMLQQAEGRPEQEEQLIDWLVDCHVFNRRKAGKQIERIVREFSSIAQRVPRARRLLR